MSSIEISFYKCYVAFCNRTETCRRCLQVVDRKSEQLPESLFLYHCVTDSLYYLTQPVDSDVNMTL